MKHIIPGAIGPYGLTFFRCLMCVIGFSVITLFLPKSERRAPSTKDRQMLLLGGVFGLAGNMLFYIVGISMTGPVDAFVIRSSQPIIVLLISVFFLHSKLSWNRIIGIILGIGGTVYITFYPPPGETGNSYTGDILIFVASFMSAIYLIMIKPYTQRINTFVVMQWMSISAVIVTFPFGIKELIEAPLWRQSFDLEIVSELAFSLIASTMIANILTVNALKYISPFVTSVYIFLLPITGTFVSVWMGIEKFSWHSAFAFMVILVGFVCVNITQQSRKRALHYPPFLH